MKSNRAKYNRNYGASPFFQKTNSTTINALQSWILNFSDTASARKYLPFNLLLVTNASNYVLRVYINQGTRYLLVPANSTKTFDSTSVPAFFSARIYNTSSTNAISADLISIEAQREQYGTSNVIDSIHKILRGV